MSLEARLKRLESSSESDAWDCRRLDIIGHVEDTVRVARGAGYGAAFDAWGGPDDPDLRPAISEAVRAVIEVMDTQGRPAARRWADRLRAELVPDAVRVGPDGKWVGTRLIIGNMSDVVEWNAYDRGDIAEVVSFPTPPIGWRPHNRRLPEKEGSWTA